MRVMNGVGTMGISLDRAAAVERIRNRIRLLRGEKVLLDADLASLYGVTTGRLNEQVKRNSDRFPLDFMFRLTNQEVASLKSQIAISRSKAGTWDGRRRSLPLAFTEHGALMAANVLSSPRAVEMSIYIVRAFVQLREALATNKHLAKKLDDLERRVAQLGLKHDTINSSSWSRPYGS